MANQAGETEQANEVVTKPTGRQRAERAAAPSAQPPAVAASSPLGLNSGPPPAVVARMEADKARAAAAVAAPAAEEVYAPTYEVLEDRDVPRAGGTGTYPLRKGQKIKQGGHDIAFLQQIGVKLRPVPHEKRRVFVPPPAVVAQPEEPQGPPVVVDVYVVLENIDVPRADGQGTFRLSAGQRIKQGGYDMQWLGDHGVRLQKLEPVAKPAGAHVTP